MIIFMCNLFVIWSQDLQCWQIEFFAFNNLIFWEPEPIWCLPFVTTQMVVLDNLESNQANSSKFMCYSFNGHNVDMSAVQCVSAVCCWVCWWAEYAGCPGNASLWTVDCGTENVIWQHSPWGGRDNSGQCPVSSDHSPVTMVPSVEVSPCPPTPAARLLTQAKLLCLYYWHEQCGFCLGNNLNHKYQMRFSLVYIVNSA